MTFGYVEDRGTFKYRIGRHPMGISKMFANRSLCFTPLPKKILLLSRLILRPEVLWMSKIKAFIPFIDLWLALQKIKMLSTKRIWEGDGRLDLLIDWTDPFAAASSISIERISMPMTKRRGDTGQPCQIPLFQEKNPVGEPLTRMKKVGVVMHSLIQEIHISGKFIGRSRERMESMFKLSKAFRRPNSSARSATHDIGEVSNNSMHNEWCLVDVTPLDECHLVRGYKMIDHCS